MRKVFHQFEGTKLNEYLPINESQSQAKQEIEDYIGLLDYNREQGRGLTLVGPSGVGKTMLASIVLNNVAEKGYRFDALSLSGYVNLLLRKTEIAQILKSGEGDDDLLDQWMRLDQQIRNIQGISNRRKVADWVLFDDVGRDYPSESGWSNYMFHDVLRNRYNRGLPSLITSNMPLQAWTNRYSEGLASFLHEATVIVVVQGHDYRTGETWNEAS